ncbi:MAG: ABC transporter permease [Calditrichia bacterium]|nr:ABC transporter permease [Calditrichia bacterium]
MNKISMNYHLFQLIIAYSKEIIREPGVIFWGIVFPILMALGLGIAFTKKPDLIRTVVVIENSSGLNHESSLAQLLNHFTNQNLNITEKNGEYILKISDEQLGNMTYIFKETDWDEAMILLKRGQINLILENREEQLHYHFDPLNPEAQLLYLKLSQIQADAGIQSPVSAGVIEPLTVTGTRYIDFLIPGLIAMGVMMSCMWGLSYGIIDKRSKKLLRRMIATPMRKSNFLIALITVRLGMNIIESILLFLFAFIFFDISIQGDLLALLIVFLAGNIAFSGIAIFISSRTANNEIGNGLINAVVLPMMVLSGIFFSYHNFPDWAITVIENLPLTLLADQIRGIFIEGSGIPEIIIPSLILTIIGVSLFSVGLRIFRWY